MIKNLKIKNYSLLKNISVNFENGFTILSGETGAGKSIMLDALALLLGKRVDRSSGHNNTEKTIIEGVFFIENSKSDFFKKHKLDFNELTIVRRELSVEGRSRAFINDTPVLLNILSDFGDQLIEIHTQNQTVFLKDEITQYAFIDELAKNKNDLLVYQEELQKYKQLNIDLKLIKQTGSLSESELDFLQYQFDELDDLNLEIGETESLEHEITFLENIEGITAVISDSKEYLNNQNGVLSLLSNIKRKFLEFENFKDIYNRIDSVIIELNDINSDFSSLSHKLDSNPEKLLILRNRLDLINRLLNKHRKKSVEDLMNYQKEIKDRIEISSSFEKEIENKKKQIENQFFRLKESANILNKKRNEILPILQKDIEKHLMNLGMPYAKFMVDIKENDNYRTLGNTSISFLFSANKGEALMDISKVASGGELSRLMLVVKYLSVKYSKVTSLIFDEIDTGVSGQIASLMANMMKEISKSTQLIAISHLPQIASKAETHIKVIKSIVNNRTVSNLITLDKHKRVEEIAKLLSGKEVTSAAFENARVLLNQ